MAKFGIGRGATTDARTFAEPVRAAGEKAAEIGAISASVREGLSGSAKSVEQARSGQGQTTQTLVRILEEVSAARARLAQGQADAKDGAATTYKVVGTGGNPDAKATASLYARQADELGTDSKGLAAIEGKLREAAKLSGALEELMTEIYAPMGRSEQRLGERPAALGQVANGALTYVQPL